MKDNLESAGYSVPLIIDSADGILQAVHKYRPDAVLMDIRLNSFIDGVDAASRLKIMSEIPVIFLTAYNDRLTRMRAEKVKPAAYLVKPVEDQTLLRTLQEVF
jgi:CheY-like chemotaxis protein